MTQIKTSPKTHVNNQLLTLYNIFIENNDERCANDLIEIYEKFKNDEFIITFAGHFSAGKSSMINALLEENILPNSPIPTSANIVKITSGSGYARVFFHSDRPLEYKAPYDLDMIKEYCQNKDDIKSIELSTVNKTLPKGSVIIDTPGIDAADDADRLLTESSLHLVDLLFYVMDYNHVQSEVNLLFLKQLQEHGIPFYLIINQIDKHREGEIPFAIFKQRIKQTFDQWDISPVGMYFTSLMNHDLPNNEFAQLKEKLFHVLHENKQSKEHMERSLHHLIQQHKQFLNDLYEEKLNGLTLNNELDVDTSHISQLKNDLTLRREQFTQLEKEFHQELTTTLNNAYLMPFEMREKAKSFLESQQSDFKVGLFRRKQKTHAERQERLNDFWTSLETTIESTITWRLRDKLKRLIVTYDVANDDIINRSQYVSIAFSDEHLINLVNSGARVTGEYILNYTEHVSAAIKQAFKREADQLWAMIETFYKKQMNDKKNVYHKYKQQLVQLNNSEKQQIRLESEWRQQIIALDHALIHPNYSLDQEILDERVRAKYEQMTEASTFHLDFVEANKCVQKEQKDGQTGDNPKSKHSIDQTITMIEQTVRTIESLPGFDAFVNDLQNKQQRLTHRSLTIALFGAFSAGKSSFANALMGHEVLPSSPNPTTAVVTKIHPISQEQPHGTVIVSLKSDEDITADLREMTKYFSPPKCALNELISWINSENIVQKDHLNHMYQAYIQAIINGYDQMNDQLGRQICIPLEEFAHLATDETKACFIQQIDLYYSCAITDQGITLVDTPGADSINARHTDVSFNFIKDADAIIYVTYYNHALSRADKDFLLQLGRVKESFELDKMFFIINATDLASNKSELDLVITYVEDELQKLGIRFPTIYPLSSKHSLDNKLNNEPVNKQMATFEAAFQQFIQHDLSQLATQSAVWDIKRAYQSLKQYMATVALDEQEREQYKDRLQQTHSQLQAMIDQEEQDIYIKQVKERIHRQLHYVQERFAIRFHDLFRETFNPTTITSSKRSELESCLRNLLDDSGYELLQEMRAVSLRVEATIKSLANDLHNVFKNKSESIDQHFILPMYDIQDIETPNYKQAFQTVQLSTFNRALRLFRGTKAFFEQRESDMMKEEIYSLLVPFIKQYMTQQQELMVQTYTAEWEQLFLDMKQQSRAHIDHYLTQQQSMLSDSIDYEMLTAKETELQAIIGKN